MVVHKNIYCKNGEKLDKIESGVPEVTDRQQANISRKHHEILAYQAKC